jgi:protein-L-isoaspartate O-methyltransferase
MKVGSRMLIPVGPPTGFHQLMQIDILEDETVKVKSLGGVRFVPLTSKETYQILVT